MDMRPSGFLTPQGIAYHRRMTLARKRLDVNNASSVQKMSQSPLKDDIIYFQNLSDSEAQKQPLIIVIQTQFMKEQ